MRLARKILTAALGAGAVVLLTAPGASGKPAVSAQDKAFMTANAQTNLAEISTAKIALVRAHAPLHDLANKILADHTKALSELKGVARSVGFTLPSTPNAAQLAQAKHLQNLGSLGFDEAYLQTQALGHRTSIANTQTEIRTGTDPAVLAYAKKYLPVAQAHLGMLNQAISGGQFAASPAPPPSPLNGPTSPIVTAGPLAHGGKTSPSSDAPWLIGLAAVIVLALGGLMLRLRRSVKPHE